MTFGLTMQNKIILYWRTLVIKGLFIMASVMFVCLVIVSCEFTESQLVKEQAITFEQEIAYRQRKENELEGKLKKA